METVRSEHAEALRRLRATPEVARWWEPAAPEWPFGPEPDYQRLVVLVEGEVAGYVQYWEDPDPDGRYADVDIFLGPDQQDRGLGTEAMRLVVGHLIEQRGHHRITLGTHVDNARALRCYEKVGFRTVGVLRKAVRHHVSGEWEDEYLMELVV